MKINIFKGTVLIGLLLLIIVGMLVITKIGGNSDLIYGVKISGVDVAGKSYNEAAYELDDKYQAFLDETISLTFEGEIFKSTLRKLGVSFDTYKTVELAYEASREIGALDSFKASVLNSDEVKEVDPAFNIDRKQMEEELSNIIPKQSPSFTINYDSVHVQILKFIFARGDSPIVVEKNQIKVAAVIDTNDSDEEILKTILARKLSLFTYDKSIDYKKEINVQPNWVKVRNGELEFDEKEIEKYIHENISPELDLPPVNAIIKALPRENGAYADVSNVIKDGRKIDMETIIPRIIGASSGQLADNNPVVIEFKQVPGKVINETSQDLGEMVLLGQGKSNFKGSPAGRDFNIRRGLKEKYNNVMVAQGGSFSYNDLLGPMTYRAGWKASLAIFGGKDLKPVPGGGLCQVSTTFYRALVYAGLNITEKSNHSLYVHYYKEYGDGLDAAIFPGSKDLKFVNDTNSYILVQAYDDGYDAYINIYGTPDGRQVSVEGPFYSGKVPEEFKNKVNPAWNQIMWIQTITRPSGEVEENILISTYRTAPK